MADPVVPITPTGPPGPQEQAVPQAAPGGLVYSTNLGEANQQIAPTWGQKFKESVKQLSEQMPIGIPGTDEFGTGTFVRGIHDYLWERDLNQAGDTKLSADAANARYPGMGFTEPVHAQIADFQFQEKIRKSKQAEWISRGPNTGTAFDLSVGAMSMLDPLNVASGMTVGAVFKGLGVAKGLSNTFTQNLIGNLSADIPSYFVRKSEHEDNISIGGSIEQSIAGAGFGTALHGLWGAFSKKFIPEKLKGEIVRESITQMENGQKVDTSGQAVKSAVRASGEVNPNSSNPGSNYKFTPLEHASDRTFYSGHTSDGKAVPFIDAVHDEGTHLTDNPDVANNIAGDSDEPGVLTPTKIDPEAKILSLDQSINTKGEPEAVARVLLNELGIGAMKSSLGEMTLKDLIGKIKAAVDSGELPSETSYKVTERLKAMGIDGVSTVEGPAGNQHNAVTMLDESKVTKEEPMRTNPDMVPDTTSSQNAVREEKLKDPSTYEGYSEKNQVELDKLKHAPPPDAVKIKESLDFQAQTAKESIALLAESDPVLHEEYKMLREQEAMYQREAAAMKDVINCYGSEL